MSRKVTYIISYVDRALEFEWVAEYLDTEEFELSFILLNPKSHSALAEFAKSRGLKVKLISYKSQASFAFALIATTLQLIKWKPELVNCHLPQGTLIGLLAAKLVGIKQRIYTRHHSTLNHVYHPHAIKYDRWSNSLATHIVAVSQIVKEVLKDLEQVPEDKVTIIRHCLDLEQFKQVRTERVEQVYQTYGIPKLYPIIGVIARYTEWKGVQYIIPAFREILADYPQAHLILANARKGDFIDEIDALLSELPPDSYTEIPFEKDLYSLYRLFDIFVHAPIDEQSEAFGQIYIEALASKVPSVFTLSGVAGEILENNEHALVVPFKDSESIKESVLKLLQDQQLCDRLTEAGEKLVKEQFSIKKKIWALEKLYRQESK